MNTDPEYFSGRVLRMGNSLSKAPGWYRDAFVLGLHSPDYDRSVAMKLVERSSSQWMIDSSEFSRQPKRAPALLYSRLIVTSALAGDFVSNYFEGFVLPPDDVLSRYPNGAMPWGSKGTNMEERAYFLKTLGVGIGPEGDVWRDPVETRLLSGVLSR